MHLRNGLLRPLAVASLVVILVMIASPGSGSDGWGDSPPFLLSTVESCSHAVAVQWFYPGAGTLHTTAVDMLGAPDGEAVPLGYGGNVTLALSDAISDEPGIDFIVHENGLAQDAIDETFRVDGSSNGVTFVHVGDGAGGSVGFDLQGTGLTRVTTLRITDLPPMEAGTAPPDLGADIDAIEAVHCSPQALPDLRIDRLEVAQAVVSEDLVRQKNTVIRVFIEDAGEPIPYPTFVSGRLHVLEPGGQELFSRDSANMILLRGACGFDESEVRAGVNSLKFFLDPEDVESEELQFWAEVDVSNAVAESDETNNSNQGSPISQSFRASKDLRIAYCTLGDRGTQVFRLEMASAADLVAQTYPVSPDKFEWHYEGHIPWSASHLWVLRARLRLQRELLQKNADRFLRGLPPYDRLVGFFQHWPFPGVLGKTVPNEAVCMINAAFDPSKVNLAVAHEMGHTFGLNGEYYGSAGPGRWRSEDGPGLRISTCAPLPFPCENYPARFRSEGLVHGRFVSESAFNIRDDRPAAWGPSETTQISVMNCVGRVLPGDTDLVRYWECDEDPSPVRNSRAVSFMGDAVMGDAFAWIADDDYGRLSRDCLANPKASLPPIATRSGGAETIWLFALISSDGYMEAAPWILSDSGMPIDEPNGTGYAIEFRAAGGALITSHAFGLDFSDGDTTAFAATLPFPAGTQEVRILRADAPIFSRQVSGAGPTVTVVSPNGGEALAGDVTVRWQASDSDGDSLASSVYYSADGGMSWVSLAVDIAGDSLQWDTELAPGSLSGRIRVLVSDGIRVAEDTSDGVFSLADRPPQALITSPGDSASVVQGEAIRFAGVLYDPEAGDSSDRLTWSADEDSLLGMGASFTRSDLSPGWHMVIARGDDTAGVVVRDSIAVFIAADGDQDGMPDAWEASYAGLNPSLPDGLGDLDSDGLPNRDEFLFGTDPTNPDTDGDGYSDGLEVAYHTDPLKPEEVPPVSVDGGTRPLPLVASIRHFPNPVSKGLIVRYAVPVTGRMMLGAYDVSGRLIATITEEMKRAGEYEVLWDGRDASGRRVASGVYFLRLATVQGTATSRIVILR